MEDVGMMQSRRCSCAMRGAAHREEEMESKREKLEQRAVFFFRLRIGALIYLRWE